MTAYTFSSHPAGLIPVRLAFTLPNQIAAYKTCGGLISNERYDRRDFVGGA